MGEIVPSPSAKSSGLQYPMLNDTNYTYWAMRMKAALKVNKVWEAIDPGLEEGEKDDLARALIFQSISENLVMQVGDHKTSKDIWEAIQSRHIGAERVKEARLQTLTAEFDRLQMKETKSIDLFSGKLLEIVAKSSALGESLEESKVVKKFLNSLPKKKFITIVAALEQVLDLKKTSFEDIVGRLKAYEERINIEEFNQEDQSKLMYARSESDTTQENYVQRRGRGHGGRFSGRGRGRGRNEERDKSHIICYRCDKAGHYASVCPDRLLKLQEAQESDNDDTQEADELMMHEVVFLNEKNVLPDKFETHGDTENIWYLDNGASNHMTGNLIYFSKLDKRITGKVRFGDDSRVDIKGKGYVLFIRKNGEKKILTDVYYIPDLKSNILSLGQATESGCEIRMKDDYLLMFDRDCKILMKAKRSNNRLYKVSMKINNIRCLQSIELKESTKWHPKLGHIGTKTMKTMMKKELVKGMKNDREEENEEEEQHHDQETSRNQNNEIMHENVMHEDVMKNVKEWVHEDLNQKEEELLVLENNEPRSFKETKNVKEWVHEDLDDETCFDCHCFNGDRCDALWRRKHERIHVEMEACNGYSMVNIKSRDRTKLFLNTVCALKEAHTLLLGKNNKYCRDVEKLSRSHKTCLLLNEEKVMKIQEGILDSILRYMVSLCVYNKSMGMRSKHKLLTTNMGHMQKREIRTKMRPNVFANDEENSPQNEGLEINEDYGRRLERNKKREDLQLLEELKKKCVIDNEDSEEEYELDDDDDDDAGDPSEDRKFLLDMIIKVKKKDPLIMNKDVKLFSSDESEYEEDGV